MRINLTAKAIWVLFIVIMTGLIGSQIIWLLGAYMLQKEGVQSSVNKCFKNSIEKEVTNRLNLFEINKQLKDTSAYNLENDSVSVNLGSVNYKAMMEAGIFQYVLDNIEIKFQIDTLDSLFQNELQKEKISNVVYNICYKDSTGVILEQRGDSLLGNNKFAFRSDSVLIVKGNRVQVVADIDLPSIRGMMWLLVYSAILVFVIGIIAYLLTQRLLTEKKLNQFRNDFVNAFTHNMKTPLGQVLTTLENINEEKYNERPELLKKHSRLAFLSTHKIQRQIEQMLTISKSEAGSLEINREDTDIQALIEDVKIRFDVSITKPVRIEVSYIPEHITAWIDKPLIEDVVSNLIDNAIKYSGESVDIKIDCFVNKKDLIIKITDNGFGISGEDQKKIFQKYERGAAFGRRDGAKGFGLGLNYAQRVILAHDGQIKLSSKLGEGSEFMIILPLK